MNHAQYFEILSAINSRSVDLILFYTRVIRLVLTAEGSDVTLLHRCPSQFHLDTGYLAQVCSLLFLS